MARLLLLIVATLGLLAQTPQQLEGRRVRVLLDMPADDSGVDVQAHAAVPVDAEVNRSRLSKYGPGLRRGQIASVTLVRIKGDHVEFHLNGGGFTNKQLMSLPGYDSPHWGTSAEERKIRDSISGTRDKERRRRLQSEYDDVRRRRVRPLRAKLEREQREQQGSRFNIRFASEREAARVTAEELTAILKWYAELLARN